MLAVISVLLIFQFLIFPYISKNIRTNPQFTVIQSHLITILIVMVSVITLVLFFKNYYQNLNNNSSTFNFYKIYPLIIISAVVAIFNLQSQAGDITEAMQFIKPYLVKDNKIESEIGFQYLSIIFVMVFITISVFLLRSGFTKRIISSQKNTSAISDKNIDKKLKYSFILIFFLISLPLFNLIVDNFNSPQSYIFSAILFTILFVTEESLRRKIEIK